MKRKYENFLSYHPPTGKELVEGCFYLCVQYGVPILDITPFCGDFFQFRLHINKAILPCFLEELTVTLNMLCGANALGIVIKARIHVHYFAMPMKKTSQSTDVIAAQANETTAFGYLHIQITAFTERKKAQ